MNLLVSWQLMLFVYAISFRETSEKVAPMENPRPTGQQLRSLASPAAWEQSLPCAAPKSAVGSWRPVLCEARSLLIPAPRRLRLVQQKKDLSAYNWNSFGLRYGRRAAPRDVGQGFETSKFWTYRGSGHTGTERRMGNGRGPGVSVLNQ
ncbi:metastasis-suppressor KiSS-1 [Saccopteryx leptura]|uniref:metastasis-suppressor KiSS-1 n=1 Tax=Saccopteryx leptura TaxID=249018 RepID=UPI00339C0DFC